MFSLIIAIVAIALVAVYGTIFGAAYEVFYGLYKEFHTTNH